jgi:hypothetical protein
MSDYVASFLINGNFFLTALEFYQELLESGQEQKLLKDFFENHKYTQEQPQTNEQQNQNVVISQSSNSQEVLFLSNELQKKDTTISMLEYEIRVLNSDVEKMRSQLRDVFVPVNKRLNQDSNQPKRSDDSTSTPSETATSNSVPTIKSNDNVTANETSDMIDDPEHTLKNLNKQPLDQQEKQIINYLIRKFLMEHNYQVTGISFTDEVSNNDLINLDDLNLDLQVSNAPNPDDHDDNPTEINSFELSLLYLYRYYYKLNPQQLQNLLNSRKDQKDKRALRKALETVEEKNRQLEELERNLIEQEKEIEDLRISNSELEEQIGALSTKPSTPATTEAGEVPTITINNNAVRPGEGLTIVSPITSSPSKMSIPMTPTGVTRQFESEKRENAVLKILGDKLPTLVRAAKSDKRDEFMPLIVSVLQYHTDQKVRDKVSNCLFTLAKKPDEAQRETIMNGCIALARRVSPERFENELLPQCWEQAMSKLPERRILVADACGLLAPYVKPTLRPSLFLSMIRQLASDKVDEVRESVALNLGRLIKTFGDDEEDISDSKSKYTIIEEMVMALLMDRSESVVKAAREQLIPPMAKWAATYNLLCSKLVNTLFTMIESLITKASPKIASDEELTSAKTILFISLFRSLLPEMYNRIVMTIPDQILQEQNVDASNFEQRKSAFDGYLQNGDFSTHNEERIPPSWVGMHWLSSVGMTRFLSIAASLDVEHNKAAVAELYATTAQWCNDFGNTFAVRFLHPRFTALCESDDSYHIKELIREAPDAELSRYAPTFVVKERLLPIYFIGILSTVISNGEAMQTFVRDGLRSLLVDISQERGAWSQSHLVLVERALEGACRANRSVLDLTLTLIHDDLMSDTSKSLRATVGTLLNSLITVVDTTTLMQRILPCVTTLSTDEEGTVQLTALKALSTIILNVDREGDFDKLTAQFDHFFQQHEKHPEVYHETLRILARIIPKVEPYFRDQFALKKLVEIGRENNTAQDDEERKTVALLLFDCYRALNGCLLTRDAIQNYILGGLEMLDADCEMFNDNSMRNSVRGMLKDLRNAVKPKGSPATARSGSATANLTPTTVPLSQIIGDVNIPTSMAPPTTPRNEDDIGQKLKTLFSFGNKKQ